MKNTFITIFSEPLPASDTPDRYTQYLDAVEARLSAFYSSLSIFRQVPPPEDLAFYFLMAAQNSTCLMCAATGRIRVDLHNPQTGRLIEDHCHRSGLVRGLLCRRCNTSEGMNGNRLWNIYRQVAPANGWCWRYYGRGSQWEGISEDPLINRIKEGAVGLTDSDVLRNSADAFSRYKAFAESLRGYAPIIADVRFNGMGGIEVDEDPSVTRRRKKAAIEKMQDLQR